jgi:transposase
MAKRYELNEWQYELIEDLLPKNGKPGGRWKPHRDLLNGMFWVLNSGARWREMPERYGAWQTVYSRFRKWRDDGTFQKMLDRLHLKLNADGTIDLETWYVDSTVIRATRSAAGAPKKWYKKKSLWRAA